MAAQPTPADKIHPPIVGKVTDTTIELYWKLRIEEEMNIVRIVVQEAEENSQTFNTIYSGPSKKCISRGLKPQTTYKYRIRLVCTDGESDWSRVINVATTKKMLSPEDLYRAIANDDLEVIRTIVDSGAVDLNTVDKYGLSPLMYASTKGKESAIDMLLEGNADINFANKSGKTALMLACFYGKTDTCRLLLKKKANPNLKDRGGCSCLHMAVDSGNIECVRLLLSSGCSVHAKEGKAGWTPFMRGVSIGVTEPMLAALLDAGTEIDKADNDGNTPMMLAAFRGHLHVVKYLIARGGDVNRESPLGTTALDFARSFKRQQIVDVLLPLTDPSKVDRYDRNERRRSLVDTS